MKDVIAIIAFGVGFAALSSFCILYLLNLLVG